MTNVRKFLKGFLTVLLVSHYLQPVESQTPIKLRSTLSSCGSSKTFTSQNGNQYHLQQSFGQQSVIGLSQYNNYFLRQGFIQPFSGSIQSIENQNLPLKIFPNPFSSDIFILFTEEVPEILYVTVSDLNGKIVYFKKFEPALELTLNLAYLAPSIYILKVNTADKCFHSKMIKL